MSVRRFTVVLLLVFFFTWGLSQIVPPGVDPGKPATWFLTATGWGFMVMLILNFLKANVVKNLEGNATIFLSAVIALGGALLAGTGLFSWMGVNLEGNLAELLTFGVTAFISSSGGWDTAKRFKAQPSGVQAVVDLSDNTKAASTARAVVTKEARP